MSDFSASPIRISMTQNCMMFTNEDVIKPKFDNPVWQVLTKINYSK